MFLYATPDKIGMKSGGGVVTYNELEAFRSLIGEDQKTLVLSNVFNDAPYSDPFEQDAEALKIIRQKKYNGIQLAHFYSGCFSKTIDYLKSIGCKVSYTVAAHDKEISRREHEKLGLAYPYPHLTDPELWKEYSRGQMSADVMICPSQHSAKVMRKYGYEKEIKVIPHGVNHPSEVKRLPDRFTVGYLGAIGPDKGLIYLLRAWSMLNYDDSELIIAGRDSQHPFVHDLIRMYACKNVTQLGWVDDVSDFYNRISLYVQPSVSEGFGIEVLEAMAYGRSILCSEGAGAVDCVHPIDSFQASSVSALVHKLDSRKNMMGGGLDTKSMRIVKDNCTWDKIRQRYIDVWKELLS